MGKGGEDDSIETLPAADTSIRKGGGFREVIKIEVEFYYFLACNSMIFVLRLTELKSRLF